MSTTNVAERFIDEKLAVHWQVDKTKSSFNKLMNHIEADTNFEVYFDEALASVFSDSGFSFDAKELSVIDLGSGVCWTSALLAKLSRIKHVYAVEPSLQRLKHAECVLAHFKVPNEKVTLIDGSFAEFDIPEKVHLIMLCGSFHHCSNKDINQLFAKAKDVLAPNGIVLIANEHYVDMSFSLRRLFALIWGMVSGRKRFYSLANLRAPYPYDNEHWRTRKELGKIFTGNGFAADFFLHKEDLCKENLPFYKKMGFHYYHAILKRTNENVNLNR